VGTPQQNGIVEMKHIHLLEITRALLFQSQVHISYWGECLLITTYLINRLPSKVLKGQTPYSILFNKLLAYKLLKTFGCLCYVSTLSSGRNKFKPRAKACVFLGYPLGQKGYKVLELDIRKILVSRDVVFREDKYPFASISSDPTPIFLYPIPAESTLVTSSPTHLPTEPILPIALGFNSPSSPYLSPSHLITSSSSPSPIHIHLLVLLILTYHHQSLENSLRSPNGLHT